MIVVVEPNTYEKHAALVEKMFQLRARIFGEKLKWDVDIRNGLERDRYDDFGPTYLIHTDDEGKQVKGSLRLLPTTGPTLLADIFSDTLPDAVHLSAPTIWECTRFCLDERVIGPRRQNFFLASSLLIEALGEVAIKAGVESILGNFDASMLRLYRRIGCEVEVLGYTKRYGETVFLGSFAVSEAILRHVKAGLTRARNDAVPERHLAA